MTDLLLSCFIFLVSSLFIRVKHRCNPRKAEQVSCVAPTAARRRRQAINLLDKVGPRISISKDKNKLNCWITAKRANCKRHYWLSCWKLPKIFFPYLNDGGRPSGLLEANEYASHICTIWSIDLLNLFLFWVFKCRLTERSDNITWWMNADQGVEKLARVLWVFSRDDFCAGNPVATLNISNSLSNVQNAKQRSTRWEALLASAPMRKIKESPAPRNLWGGASGYFRPAATKKTLTNVP